MHNNKNNNNNNNTDNKLPSPCGEGSGVGLQILVTGSAGFIGAALVERLLAEGHEVVGIDNINSYYDPALKLARLRRAGIELPTDAPLGTEVTASDRPYRFIRLDITDGEAVEKLFAKEKFDIVVNLAAQAGVRYSIENPMAYIQSNIVGFTNLLEAIKRHPVRHFVYASSSSVYGGNTKVPFSESDPVDNQVSTYAATKRSNELLANVYAKLYGIPATGLRFFTVYGPWGRPDMAPMLFSDAITHGRPIKVFNNGNLSRDFTYIDDIVEGIVRVIRTVPEGDVPHEIYNIGHGEPMQLMDFITILEEALGKKAEIRFMPMQPGDVYTTYADTSKLAGATGYRPVTTLREGIARFAEWYLSTSRSPQGRRVRR